MLDSWKRITLFVFEINCNLVKTRTGLALLARALLIVKRQWPAGRLGLGLRNEPSLNSYVQDFLIYLTNTAWGGEKLAKGGHVWDT